MLNEINNVLKKPPLLSYIFSSFFVTYLLFFAASPSQAATIRVNPGDSIQVAIENAQNGDTIEVLPGTYNGGFTIKDKQIKLTSTGNVEETIISGGDPVITMASSASGSEIIGFTFTNCGKGIVPYGVINIINNFFDNCSGDCIDYEGGDGLVKDNYFLNCGDDSVDLDGATSVTIENNVMAGSKDDGIEIRLHSDQGKTLKTIIRNNKIMGSATSRARRCGIQIMEQGVSPINKTIIIERNLIANQGVAGISLTGDLTGESEPSAWALDEAVRVYNNTLVNNYVGLAGGGNLVGLNNIFYKNGRGFLNKDDNSSKTIVAYTLFNSNATNYTNSNVVDGSHNITINPQFIDELDFHLNSSSPAINAGAINYTNPNSGENISNFISYSGPAPDLGWYEYIQSQPTPPPVPGDANGDGRVTIADYIIWLNHYGMSTGNGPQDGDFDNSGSVGIADYIIWLNNYGT